MKKSLLVLGVAMFVSTASLQAANIVWVSFHSGDNTPSANAAAAGFTQAPDIGYTALLKANGHNVTRVLSSGTPDVAALNKADLVIISRSVPSGDYSADASTAAWASIKAPMMILGGYVLRNSRLGFTTGATIPDTAGSVSLKVNSPSNPIFAGITLGASNVMANSFANIVSYTNAVQRGISVNTDPIAPGGTVLATIGTAGDPAFGGMVIGEWQAGASMTTSPVDVLGGRRLVFLTGSREGTTPALTSEAAGLYDLTPDGAKMFLNAVKYMAVPEPSTWALMGLAFSSLCLRRRKK